MRTAREIRILRYFRSIRSSAALLTASLVGFGVGCARPEPIDLADSNLLLITVDTLRTDRVGAFGDDAASTPAMDRLAREGIAFSNAYAHVPLTLPSHSALFTGRYPFSLQVRNNGTYYLRRDETTLAERLSDAGYRTAAFVSSYVLASKFGLDQGFDEYDDTIESGDVLQSFTSEVPADEIVDRFEAWLERERPDRFFAWLHFYDPHLPYEPPEPYAGQFGDDPYRGEIAFVDSQIGRALDALRRRQDLDRTLVVVTSDHGEAFGEHGEIGHGILTYEESLRIPLIMSAGDRLPRGRVIDARVSLVDLLPTVLELLGLPESPQPSTTARSAAPGHSLVPLLEGGGEDSPRRVYFESLLGPEDYNWAPITGLISGRHKYISVPQPELYDLARDPTEQENLYRRQPQLAQEIDEELRRLLLDSENPEAAPRRELTAEDTAHLRALGYLGAAEEAESLVDPKQGILIDRRIKEIRALVDSGEVERAEEEARGLAEQYPDLSMAGLYALRHEIALRLGDRHGAIEILQDGIVALPDSIRLRLLLANVLLDGGRSDDAIAVSREILDRSPRFSQALILLGRAAEAKGQIDEAIMRYDEALELEPRSLPLQRQRAEAILRAGRTREALDELTRLAHAGAFGAEPERIYRIAVLSSQLGDQQRAEELFRLGLESAPGGVHHVTFGLLLLQNGKAAEARRHIELALERYPDDLDPQQRSVAEATLARLVTPTGE